MISARAVALASTGARPTRLIDHGYRFRAPTLDSLRHCLGRGAASVSDDG